MTCYPGVTRLVGVERTFLVKELLTTGITFLVQLGYLVVLICSNVTWRHNAYKLSSIDNRFQASTNCTFSFKAVILQIT